MSFWELNISPFLGIAGSALVAWGVLRASRREAKTAEEESAKRREEYFRKSVDEQGQTIENLADEQRSMTQKLADDLRASDRENAALDEVMRLVQSLSRVVSIGASSDREGPDVQSMTFEAMAGAASAARISVLLAPHDDTFTDLLSEAVDLFRDRASEFTPFGTRPKPNFADMARLAGAIIGSTIEWFRPGRDPDRLVDQMRMVRDELDAYLRRAWPPDIKPLPAIGPERE